MINDVDQQDRLAQVAADGSFTLKLNGEDNVIVDIAGIGSGQIEKQVLRCTDSGMTGVRIGRDSIGAVPGAKLGVPVFPAMP